MAHLSRLRLRFVWLIILLSAAACQPTAVLPTASPPSPPPTAAALAVPATRAARTVATGMALPPTDGPLAVPAQTMSDLPTDDPLAVPTSAALVLISPPLPVAAAEMALMSEIVIGSSVEGRPLTAQQMGTGERLLLIVGGIHGGYEANTVQLVEELIAHFRQNPADILPGVRLALLPSANPDGLAYGRTARGRFNGAGVDLNRNWGCGWSAEAFWRGGRVNPGTAPFSEPETQALAAFIQQARPAAVIFYHSAADGIFAGNCPVGGGVSAPFAAALGEAGGYSYGRPFTAYPVTGTAASWVDGQAIPSVDFELRTSRGTELEDNLRALMAAQRWLLEQIG